MNNNIFDSSRDSQNITPNLESKLTKIEVKKRQNPLMIPEHYGYHSIRNPAAFLYEGKVGLLYTVRHSRDHSFLHTAWSKDGENFELKRMPFIEPLLPHSKLAVEDARVSKMDEEYWITFTSVKDMEKGNWILRNGFAKTKDFKKYFDRQIILDEKKENKNTLFFRNKKGEHYVIDRPFNLGAPENPGAEITKLIKINPLEFGEFSKYLVPRNEGSWESWRVGVNTPPVRIRHKEYGDSLFMLYHGAKENPKTYCIGYLIADAENPLKIYERSKEPIIKPELDYETGKNRYSAEVPNVIFGCGIVPLSKKTMRFYYSGADKYPSYADISSKDWEIQKEFFK